jgi:hypothetical protein
VTRLNGWQRLWVVVSALWTLAVFGVGYFLWPMPEMVSHGEVYAQMIKNGADSGARFADFVEALGSRVPVGTTLSFDPYWGTASAKPPGKTVDIGGHRLQFAFEGMSEPDMNRASSEYYIALRRVLAVKRSTFVAGWLALSAIPVAALYILGWAVAWIRRGFAQ